MKKLTALISIIILVLVSTKAQDIKEWRGQNRDGSYQVKNLLNEWPEDGPEILWSTEELPEGYSSYSIVDERIYTTGMRDTMDVCLALDLKGKILWETIYGRSWNGSYPLTRCTPTYDNGKLYVTSGFGDVACIDAASGDLNWKVEGFEKWDIVFNIWGIAESLVVFDDKVIYNPIGKKTTTVALDKENGKVVWESASIEDSAAYVSPIFARYAGKNMIINVSSNYIYGVDIDNGDMLWTFKYRDVNTPTWHPNAPIINCNSALFSGNRVYATSGYNHTGVMIELNEDGSKATQVWSDTLLDTHHGGVVKLGDYIYGSNWINNSTGNWVCIDWNTGEKMWEEKWNCKGSIIAVNDKLIISDEKRGMVGLLEGSPEGFNLLGSFKTPLGKGPYWTHPVIKDGVMYIRHNKALMAYKVSDI